MRDVGAMDKRETAVCVAMERIGFELMGTGGGCTAFIAYGDGVEMWVTEGNEPSHPTRMSSPVTLGVYPTSPDGLMGEGFALFQFKSLKVALASLVLLTTKGGGGKGFSGGEG